MPARHVAPPRLLTDVGDRSFLPGSTQRAPVSLRAPSTQNPEAEASAAARARLSATMCIGSLAHPRRCLG